MKYPSFDLSGKVAIVTGGGRGIGEAIALSLAHFGSSVAIADINLKDAENVVKQITKMGRKGLAVEVDISNIKQIADMVDRTVKSFGGIDILVNNAGVLGGGKSAEELTAADWDRTMAVNLRGVFFCSQAVGKAMIKQQKKGKIINISSMGAIAVLPQIADYSSSKGGVISITRTLATEWAKHGINVNAIAPTFIKTPMTKDWLSDEAWRQFLTNRIPLGRLGEPEDIAGAVIYLASTAADMVTGHVLAVDGGWNAGESGVKKES